MTAKLNVFFVLQFVGFHGLKHSFGVLYFSGKIDCFSFEWHQSHDLSEVPLARNATELSCEVNARYMWQPFRNQL